MTGIFLQSPGIFPVFGPGCPEDLATCGEECEQNPGWECWEWIGRLSKDGACLWLRSYRSLAKL